MEGRSSQEIISQFKEILKSNSINDEVSQVLVESPASLKGAGMTSHPYYVTVQFTNTKIPALNLFVKCLPSNSPHFEQLNETMKLFEKESTFFTEYVPAVQEFCKSKGQNDLLNFYSKCYFADGKMIVFDNLAVGRDYIQLSKQERQGLESSRLAFATLAKHHAVSLAFIKQLGGSDAFCKRFPSLCFESFDNEHVKAFVEPLVENGIKTNIKILEKSGVYGKEEAIVKLEQHVGKGFAILLDTIHYKPEHEKILTLNHGDFWNNNMMFMKCKETGELSKPVIFDFQVTRYNCPALDIGNFMFTTMKPETRRTHLQELVQLYLDVFKNTTNKLGNPVALTYDELFAMLRQKAKYGFWFAIWLAVEVGYAVINNVEVSNDASPDEFSVEFDKHVQKWVGENPEKSVECAKAIVELMKEYSSLISD